MAKKLSKEQWEQRIRDAGAGRYEFVRWEVDGEFGAHKKCVVICSVDNYAWSVEVHDIVNKGRGCPQCSGNRKWKADERIEQINSLENILFLSWVGEFKGGRSKANVRCGLDSYVWSADVNNLVNSGSRCPQCSGNRIWTELERVEQINKLENIRFVSWAGGYKNAFSKANVRCSVDNHVWSAAVDSLLNIRSGCPKCAKYGFKLDKKGYIYALRSECGRYLKVGISNKPSRRHTELARATPFTFNLVEQFSGDGVKIYELEKHFHSKYESAGFTGFDGATEWLICSEKLLSELRRVSIEHE